MRAGSNLSILLLICFPSVGIVAWTDSTLAEEPVYFADPILKAVVERELGISDPTPTDMLALTTLNVNNWSITDLTGLEYATNLTALELVNHRISDISVIAGLKNLMEVSLGYNRISDISAVAGLTRLTRLSLSKNRISDISAVAGLTNLAALHMYDNQISDISAVAGLTNLMELCLHGNRISDNSMVTGLTNLTELNLGNNQVNDISALAGLENLTRLSLNNNRISDISPAAGPTNLTHLYLHDNQISEIPALLGLTNLTYLNLQRNPLNRDACEMYIPQILENNPGITIHYDPYVQYTLVISSTAGGSVSIPGEGVFPYDYGGTLPIVAVADAGHHFVFWTGTAVEAGKVANPTADDTTVELYSDYTLKAHFLMDRGVIYVDNDASGSNDGSTWTDAYTFLQDALTDANNSTKPVQVRVAQGIYIPDRGVGITPGDRGATFRLINGVTLRGGYAGSGETDPNARDVELYQSILSGDLAGNDIDVNDPCDLEGELTRSDNSWNVVTGSGTNETAVLDGFTITAGYDATIVRNGYVGGAGMLNRSGRPTLVTCTFTGNAAVYGSGGGILNYRGSAPVLIDCTFARNYAALGAGVGNWDNSTSSLISCRFDDNYAGRGGGMSNGNSNPKLTNCSFSRNSAPGSPYMTDRGGGAMWNKESSLTLSSCTFNSNSADRGGAIYNEEGANSTLAACIFQDNLADRFGGAICGGYEGHSVLTNCTFKSNSAGDGGAISIWGPALLTNCTFTGNSATGRGGAIDGAGATARNCIFTGNRALGDGSTGGAAFHMQTTTFTNCTFIKNWADFGCAVYCFGSAHINHCILWGTGDQIYVDDPYAAPTSVCYSDVQGSWPGQGNIDVDPCFADPGRWVSTVDPNQTVEPNDPNAIWIDGDYHLKSQAGRWDPQSQSWVRDDTTSPGIDAGDPSSPVGQEPFPNGGIINIGAYGGTAEASKSYFGEPICETIVAGDINGDCKVDFEDFEILALHWLEKRFVSRLDRGLPRP